MLFLLKEISRARSLRIYAFSLLTNHIHLLTSPLEGDLSDAMRDVFARYATKFNKKYERKGHLFSGPYRQAVCLDDTYLLAASIYIHMNPVRARLSKTPLEYRWSSCRLYCDPEAPRSFVDPGLILKMLASRYEEAKRIYVEMLERCVRLDSGHVLEKEDAIEQFRNQLASVLPSIFKKVWKRRKVSSHMGIDLLSLEDLEGLLEGMRKASPVPAAREAKKFLIEQLIARGYRRAEIAERLGMSRKTVYNILMTSK